MSEDQHTQSHPQMLQVRTALHPSEIYQHIVEAGVEKEKWPLDKQICMGLLAAFYIGFSYTTMLVVGGLIPKLQTDYPGLYNLILGGFGFPLGLFMICVVGADLFTSNCSYMMVGVWEGYIPVLRLIKNWTFSWFINLAGGIIMALIVYWAWILHGRDAYLFWLVEHKTEAPFYACLCRGILANWLVNLAVWIANAANDIPGKAIGIWLPISAFIAMGGEHCIANQFVFSLARLHGTEVTTRTMIVKNLIPSTIGNIIGGALFVGTLYSYSLGSLATTCKTRIINAAHYVTGRIPPTNHSMHSGHSVGSISTQLVIAKRINAPAAAVHDVDESASNQPVRVRALGSAGDLENGIRHV